MPECCSVCGSDKKDFLKCCELIAEKEFNEQSIDETLITDEDISRALELDTLEREGMREKLLTLKYEDLKAMGVV